jgi:hypothetical protein
MSLLLDEDYCFLDEAEFVYVEDEARRFFVFRNFRLPSGQYKSADEILSSVEVLYIIPPNYNTEGGDMFWVYPQLFRADGKTIPNANGPGEDSRMFEDREFLRWSRHWNNSPWKPKIDNVHRIVDRITWAFANPDATR